MQSNAELGLAPHDVREGYLDASSWVRADNEIQPMGSSLLTRYGPRARLEDLIFQKNVRRPLEVRN